MILTMRQEIVNIADKFCEVYGITRQDLFQSNKYKGGKKKKVVNGVNVSTIRMALGYYLTDNFPITISEVASLIGYNDHSTISYNNQRIYFYIKNGDVKFSYYWAILNEIAKEYNPRRYKRIDNNVIIKLN